MASDAKRLQELWRSQREAASPAVTETDWRCPFHGRAVRKVSNRTGAPFIGCPECHSFARPNPLAHWLGWRIGYLRPEVNLFPDDLPF